MKNEYNVKKQIPTNISLALDRVQAINKKKNNSPIIHTNDITRKDRELLLHHHWLEEVIRGWYLLIRPDSPPGESTSWYANYWNFLKSYLTHHYGKDYCLSAESSIDLHLGNTLIPKQIIVISRKGSGNFIQLPHDSSLD